MDEPGRESYRVVVGLGSNLGDRKKTLGEARDHIARIPGVTVLASSRVYETKPVGLVEQADFLNAATLVRTTLVPRSLLAALFDIERALGRVRPDPVRFGPRTLDLDLLWLEGSALSEPDLAVPHPRLVERAFALVPLCELVPKATDPTTGLRYADLARAREPLTSVGAL